jgi:peptidyl-prolyl cis-trans isomerase C
VRPRTWLLLVALLAVGACADDGGRDGAAGPVLATYDGGRYTAGDFRAAVERMAPNAAARLVDPDLKRHFVEGEVMTRLLAAQGRARGYDRDPDIVREVRELEERLVVQRVMRDLEEPPPVSDEEVRAAYDSRPELYSGGQVRVRHILVKDDALARRLLAEIRADPDKFVALAKVHSIDKVTKDRGGDLGFFGPGRMVPEFERAAFALKQPGDVSDVVKTPFGYHILMLIDRREGVRKPLAEVQDRIRVALVNEKRQARRVSAIDELKDEAHLQIDEAALAAVPIPPPTAEALRMGGH